MTKVEYLYLRKTYGITIEMWHEFYNQTHSSQLSFHEFRKKYELLDKKLTYFKFGKLYRESINQLIIEKLDIQFNVMSVFNKEGKLLGLT